MLASTNKPDSRPGAVISLGGVFNLIWPALIYTIAEISHNATVVAHWYCVYGEVVSTPFGCTGVSFAGNTEPIVVSLFLSGMILFFIGAYASRYQKKFLYAASVLISALVLPILLVYSANLISVIGSVVALLGGGWGILIQKQAFNGIKK
ncbi:MAG: hypothetical protein KGI04_02815 [Candidatus Micrarchaeota archaeon]|nr:hypothetical protein [Candidatus Micrarchaeota archaeon]